MNLPLRSWQSCWSDCGWAGPVTGQQRYTLWPAEDAVERSPAGEIPSARRKVR